MAAAGPPLPVGCPALVCAPSRKLRHELELRRGQAPASPPTAPEHRRSSTPLHHAELGHHPELGHLHFPNHHIRAAIHRRTHQRAAFASRLSARDGVPLRRTLAGQNLTLTFITDGGAASAAPLRASIGDATERHRRPRIPTPESLPQPDTPADVSDVGAAEPRPPQPHPVIVSDAVELRRAPSQPTRTDEHLTPPPPASPEDLRPGSDRPPTSSPPRILVSPHPGLDLVPTSRMIRKRHPNSEVPHRLATSLPRACMRHRRRSGASVHLIIRSDRHPIGRRPAGGTLSPPLPTSPFITDPPAVGTIRPATSDLPRCQTLTVRNTSPPPRISKSLRPPSAIPPQHRSRDHLRTDSRTPTLIFPEFDAPLTVTTSRRCGPPYSTDPLAFHHNQPTLPLVFARSHHQVPFTFSHIPLLPSHSLNPISDRRPPPRRSEDDRLRLGPTISLYPDPPCCPPPLMLC